MTPKGIGTAAILFAVTVESLAQLSLKVGAAGGPGVLAKRWARLTEGIPLMSSRRGWIGVGALLYGLEICLYTVALRELDVSVAFPMGSLCFVGVAVLSGAFLGERVGRVRWLGICCIVAGTICVAC